MITMNSVPFNPEQLEMFPELRFDEGGVYKQSAKLLRENLVAVVERMIAEARRGSVQAAKYIYPDISHLLDNDQEVNLWETLKEDDGKRQN